MTEISKKRKKELEKNIWKFYLYRFFTAAMFITPVFVLFLQENGLSVTEVMILQAVYTAVIMVGVIPSGLVADYIGRKTVLIMNSTFYVTGWIAYAVSTGFWSFFVAELLIAVSAAMWNASGSSFFYDNLKEIGTEGRFKRLFGNVTSINYSMNAIGALVGGYIAVHSLRLTFWASVIPAVIAMLVAFTFTETKSYKHGDKHYLYHLKDAMKFTARHPRVRLFIIYSALSFAVGFSVWMLYQPYLKSIGISLVGFGWIYFAMMLLGAAGSKIAHAFEGKLGEKRTLAILMIVTIISLLGMSQGLWIFGAIFPLIIVFSGGIFEPVLQDYLHKHIESHHRATVMSLHSLVIELFATIAAPFFGWLVDFWSLRTAFIAAAIISLIDLVILLVVLGVILRRERS